MAKVEVIAYTQFLHPPTGAAAREDQDRGSSLARLIETAGRVCYASWGKGRPSSEFHANILASQHGSVTEHASLSFHISGISRACAQEWTRHRAGCAVSMRSGRYVDEGSTDWCWHPSLQPYLDALTPSGSSLAAFQTQARQLYRELVRLLTERLDSLGLDHSTARKQARSAARGALGLALSTELIWTANIRALRNVLEQRASPYADGEIRLLANAVFDASLPHCPEYLRDYEKTPAPDGIGFCLTTLHRKI